jgi:hypothetical protein
VVYVVPVKASMGTPARICLASLTPYNRHVILGRDVVVRSPSNCRMVKIVTGADLLLLVGARRVVASILQLPGDVAHIENDVCGCRALLHGNSVLVWLEMANGYEMASARLTLPQFRPFGGF